MASGRRRAAAALTALAVIAALVLVLARLQRLPSGPVEIAWDREPCAFCRMLIGDPAFAAQIQTRDGHVLDFDDPGCLLAYEAAHAPAEHATYFHEVKGTRWLPRDRTAFVAVDQSPMGFGLGAVEIGTPGALSLDEARARVLARGREGPVSHGGP